MSPSMENTPSVATRARPAAGRAAASLAARSAMSLWRKAMTSAPDTRAPAQMQAWASSSTSTTSLGPTKVGMVPRLAR